MRKEFAQWCETKFAARPKSLFLTGDLGYKALEDVAVALGPRFINAGVAEQNMISVAAGLARQGLEPLCYSIAPFAVFRPCEQLRLDVGLHDLNVKIVANGGGYGYGIMGASHHAIEDLALMSSLPGFQCFIPLSNDDVAGACDAMVKHMGPTYLRLGAGVRPTPSTGPVALPAFAPIRQLTQGSAPITIVGLGPVLLNAWAALIADTIEADLFCVSQLPLAHFDANLSASLQRTGRLLIIEEHVSRGGLAEHLSLWLLKSGLAPKIRSLTAQGYTSARYGSQSFHQKESQLDTTSLRHTIQSFAHERPHERTDV